ncbi:MAG: amidohydrolase [Calditrichaeota bacterium]|nr:MAG: amidohydrolase [Calditrichota bacterium]
MRNSRVCSFVVACLLGACLTLPAAAQDLIILGGNLFDSVGDTLRPNTGIVVAGGKFLEVGTVPEDLPESTRTLRLRDDQTILPGLFDLHAHYNVNLFGRRRRDETHVIPVVFLANGVTSTFPAGEYDPEDMWHLRLDINSGRKIGPRLFNSGPYFGPARIGWNPDITKEQLFAEVDLWAERGVMGFKAKRISARHLAWLIERAHWHGLTVTGHLDSGFRDTINPKAAILLGIDRVEHFLGGDAIAPDKPAYATLVDVKPGTPEFRDIASLFIKHHVYFDATLTAYGYFGERGPEFAHWTDETAFFTPFVQEWIRSHPPRRFIEQFDKIYKVKFKTLKAFFDAGGGPLITLGTDHPSTGEYLAGFSAHRELEAFVMAGIPPAAALKMATINGARALNLGEKLGSIEPGKFADFFVVNGNPLADIRKTRNVEIVVKSGVVYRAQDLLNSVVGKLGPTNEKEAEQW